MPRNCVIVGCKSGYRSNTEKVSLFKVPSDELMFEKWVKATTPAIKNKFKKTHCICEKHFLPSDIVRHFVHKDGNGRIIAKVAHKQPRHKKTAVPSIFPSLPHHNEITVAARNIEDEMDSSTSTQSLVGSITENVYLAVNDQSVQPVENMNGDINTTPSTLSKLMLTTPIPEPMNNVNVNGNHSVSQYAVSSIDVSSQDNKISCTRDTTSFDEIFAKIYNDVNVLQVPLGWFRSTSTNEKKWVAFSILGIRTEGNCVQTELCKSMLIMDDGKIHISVKGKSIPTERICRSFEQVHSLEDLSRLLKMLADINICCGVMFPSWSSVKFQTVPPREWCIENCLIVCDKRICSKCQKLKKSITEQKRRQTKSSTTRKIDYFHKSSNEKSKIISSPRRLCSHRLLIERAKKRIQKLKNFNE